MKKTIRLSESDLHALVKRSVNKILKENMREYPVIDRVYVEISKHTAAVKEICTQALKTANEEEKMILKEVYELMNDATLYLTDPHTVIDNGTV